MQIFGGSQDAIINIMITNCITCKTKLIPIVYGQLNPDMLEMQNKGIFIIGSDSHKGANSYCLLCEEAYGDYTDSLEILS